MVVMVDDGDFERAAGVFRAVFGAGAVDWSDGFE